MNFSRLLNSNLGRMLISVILGLGLATLFRKACTDSSCLMFNGPVIDEVNGKTYQFDEYCYKYELKPSRCDSKKRTVEIDDAPRTSQMINKDNKKTDSWFPFT